MCCFDFKQMQTGHVSSSVPGCFYSTDCICDNDCDKVTKRDLGSSYKLFSLFVCQVLRPRGVGTFCSTDCIVIETRGVYCEGFSATVLQHNQSR